MGIGPPRRSDREHRIGEMGRPVGRQLRRCRVRAHFPKRQRGFRLEWEGATPPTAWETGGPAVDRGVGRRPRARGEGRAVGEARRLGPASARGRAASGCFARASGRCREAGGVDLEAGTSRRGAPPPRRGRARPGVPGRSSPPPTRRPARPSPSPGGRARRASTGRQTTLPPDAACTPTSDPAPPRRPR